MKKTFLLLSALLAGGAALAQDASPPAPSTSATTSDAAPEPPTETLSAPAVAPVVLPDSGAEPAAEASPNAVSESSSSGLAPVAAEPPPTAVPAHTSTPKPYVPPLQLETAGRWAGEFNAGFSLSAGNTQGETANIGLDSTYTRPDDKLSLFASYQESDSRSETDGVVTTSITALQWRLGSRYDRDIDAQHFGFVGLEFNHDRVLQLDLRSVVSSGLGRHVIKDKETQWDVYGGLSYREDYYSGDGVEVDGAQRTRYAVTETLFGEESTHELAVGTKFKQKFVLYPGVLLGNGTRATLDAGLLVDLSKTLSLSVKLQGRYDSQTPASAAEKYDLYFITGLSVKFGS